MTALDSDELPVSDLIWDITMVPFLTVHPGGITMVDEQ